jgi:hypothetical protein
VPAFSTAAARCRPAGAQAGEEKGVASAREGQGGEARAALELGVTRGGEAQQEVARGSRKWRAAALQQRSRGQRGRAGEQRGARGRRKRGGGPRDWFAKTEKSSDLTVNLNFPLIQKPNEKMIKTEVVEFFKPYNIA